LSVQARPGEFGCPEDRELKARLIGAGM